ncbi:two-component sensor histidine kinase [Streptomyces sp. F63]|uniref:sensor histidine kinase n=1 Tax=Streptomyces sp. F63 TaxID=2824887 RepID=UPI001B360606|nr:histidine kinase [Streptomyces sp. F63]MBQ0987653.1 two-component sensor histidine kinase [Streptomyces sp. F63]
MPAHGADGTEDADGANGTPPAAAGTAATSGTVRGAEEAAGPLGPAGGGATTAHVPVAGDEQGLRLQLNALQALARHVFAFRLAMIALGTPFALHRTAPGPATWLIGSAVVCTFMGSYVLFRDWERFGPLLLRHPALLGIDLLFGALLLLTATPESTLGYVTVCTPLLAGLCYGWRGAGVFAGLQILVLAAAYGANPSLSGGLAARLVLPGFCVIAGAAGVVLRNLLLRFGAAGRALAETRARLAATEAVCAERARLAREMHDSVAKTLHGLALAAESLAASVDRTDPDTVRQRADLVARAARRAAAESRELLSDLRRTPGGPRPDRAPGEPARTDIGRELAARAADWSHRTGIPVDVRVPPGAPLPPVPPAVARQLLTIAAEALENAARHARANRVTVEAGVTESPAPEGTSPGGPAPEGTGTAGGPAVRTLHLRVTDDGRGLRPGTDLETLRRNGHFGLLGMAERAAGIGARLRIGSGPPGTGTEVRLELPLELPLEPTPVRGPVPPVPSLHPAGQRTSASPPPPCPLLDGIPDQPPGRSSPAPPTTERRPGHAGGTPGRELAGP